jgi:hypothetical protein
MDRQMRDAKAESGGKWEETICTKINLLGLREIAKQRPVPIGLLTDALLQRYILFAYKTFVYFSCHTST